jgi:CubicO group peptidase (beta-lactamase class C family)
MNPDIWMPVRHLMDRAVMGDVFPGAGRLGGGAEGVLFKQSFGVANRFTGEPVTLQTVFDLASLTKPLATALTILYLIEKGKLGIETCLGEVLPAFRNTSKHSIQIRHLLYHTSGLPAHREYYHDLALLPMAERKTALRRLLVKEPLVRAIGVAPEYSDLGFMMLCWVIEEVTHERLDRFVSEKIYRPLGLRNLFFMDVMAPTIQKKEMPFAATECCSWRKALMAGAVSDDNAWVTGGIDGHAGLFGTAEDVYGLLKALLAAFHGKANSLFCPELVRAFFKRDAVSSRALGFDTPNLEGSSSGSLFSVNTVGHLGFTGTSFWMDLDRGMVVVLLTNRIHPHRNNNRIRAFRPIVHDAVMKILLAGKGLDEENSLDGDR